jgi:hypothetical protein
MKLEMNRAWNDAVRLVRRSREVILIVAGVFFFLPYLAFMLVAPDPMAGLGAAQPQDMEQTMKVMSEFYSQVWWAIVLIAILQGIGMLGLLALLTDRRRPTVGEAIRIGASKVLSYVAAYLMFGMIFATVVMLLASLAALSGATALVGVIFVLAFIAWVVLFVRFSLVGPILVKEGTANPVTALIRSWRLTAGNTWRLFAFFFLLVIATFVVTMLASAILSLGFGLFGAESARIGDALVMSLVNAAWATLFLAVLSAVHDQFSTPSQAELSGTFE